MVSKMMDAECRGAVGSVIPLSNVPSIPHPPPFPDSSSAAGDATAAPIAAGGVTLTLTERRRSS